MLFGGENADSYHDEGLTAMVKGDLDRAVQFFSKAIQMDRSHVGAFHQLGRCYLRLGEAQRAVDILSQVLNHKPALVPARLDLGFALIALGNLDGAQEQFRAILSAHPENWRAHLGLAQVCFTQGKFDNAVTLASAARSQGGGTFPTLFLLGRAAKRAGNGMVAEEALNAALALIEKSVELAPDSPDGHFLRGEVCLAQERFAPALEHYRAAEDRVEPNKYYAAFGESYTRLDILARRGLCLQRIGNTEAAKEVGRQILSADANSAVGKTLANL
jgi:tetratricopeptide (TPR) repeat protein